MSFRIAFIRYVFRGLVACRIIQTCLLIKRQLKTEIPPFLPMQINECDTIKQKLLFLLYMYLWSFKLILHENVRTLLKLKIFV